MHALHDRITGCTGIITSTSFLLPEWEACWIRLQRHSEQCCRAGSRAAVQCQDGCQACDVRASGRRARRLFRPRLGGPGPPSPAPSDREPGCTTTTGMHSYVLPCAKCSRACCSPGVGRDTAFLGFQTRLAWQE